MCYPDCIPFSDICMVTEAKVCSWWQFFFSTTLFLLPCHFLSLALSPYFFPCFILLHYLCISHTFPTQAALSICGEWNRYDNDFIDPFSEIKLFVYRRMAVDIGRCDEHLITLYAINSRLLFSQSFQLCTINFPEILCWIWLTGRVERDVTMVNDNAKRTL